MAADIAEPELHNFVERAGRASTPEDFAAVLLDMLRASEACFDPSHARDARTYRVYVRTPDDPDGWTAIGDGHVGDRYQYVSGDVAVVVDWT